MAVILYSHTGSGNHGCEALVRSTAKLLRDKPTLYSTGHDEDIYYNLEQVALLRKDIICSVPRKSLAYALAAFQTKLTRKSTLFTKFARIDFLENVHEGDLCLSIGGDNYCYAGTEILGDLNFLLKKRGAKTVLWGSSIDPEAISPEMIEDLKRYDLITVREPLTQVALANAGVFENVKAVADPAFLLDLEQTHLPDGFIPGNTIGLNLSPLILNYTDRRENALDSFYALIEHILKNTNSAIALIPHVFKATGSDVEILKPIWEKYQETGRVILVPDQNCMRLKYIISQCRLFVGARTHATIAAYSSLVPTLAIGYSVKSRGIATDLFGSYEHYVLPIQQLSNPKELIDAYDWLAINASTIRMHLAKVIPEYQEKSRMGMVYLNELIQT